VIFPLSNALSDHEAECIIVNKFFLETKVNNGKYKNKFKIRLIMSANVSYFQEQLSQESSENVFSTNDVNSSFYKFLSTFSIKFTLYVFG
jgi:hypothetical protein